MNKFTELREKHSAIVYPYSVRYLLPAETEELRDKLAALAEEYKEYLESYSVDIYVWETMPQEHKNIFISCGLEEQMRTYTDAALNYKEKPEYSEYRYEEERTLYNEIMTMTAPPVFSSGKEKIRFISKHIHNLYFVYSKEDPIEKQIEDINRYLQMVINKLGGREMIKNLKACSRWDTLNEAEKKAYELIGKKEELMNTATFTSVLDLKSV